MKKMMLIEIYYNLVEPAFIHYKSDHYSHQQADICFPYMFQVPKQTTKMVRCVYQLFYIPLNKSIRKIQDIKIEVKNGRNRLFTVVKDKVYI